MREIEEFERDPFTWTDFLFSFAGITIVLIVVLAFMI